MNVVLRAQLADGGSLILKQALPFVAKFPDIPAPIERSDVECEFYRSVQGSKAAEKLPRLIGYIPEHHLLCFSDLGAAADFTHLYQRETGQSAPHKTLLGWLTQLHKTAIPDPSAFDNLEMRKLNHEHIFALPFIRENGLEFSPAVLQARESLLEPAVVAVATALGERYLDTTRQVDSVLLHGDFYPGSWLGQPDDIAVIDPEFCFVGPREFDLGVYLAHGLMCGESVAQLEAALAAYELSFDHRLAWQFAGVEVVRRILGVAQLPLRATDHTKIEWLQTARDWMLAS